MSLIDGLKHHTESQQPSNFSQRVTEAEAAKQLTSVDSICTSERKEESPKLLFLSHSPFQPHPCSTPCHDYVSPPPSPWLSPSFSTYATSPPFLSFAPHFSSPRSLSPLSSNTSFFSFSPTTPHSGPPARCPPHPAPREGSPPNSSASSMWRPWFWWSGPETDELRTAVPPSGNKLQQSGCGEDEKLSMLGVYSVHIIKSPIFCISSYK